MKNIKTYLIILFSSLFFYHLFSNRFSVNNINPNSPFYVLDRFIEDISVKLTKDPEKKVIKLGQHAEERLHEMNDDQLSNQWINQLFKDYGSNLTSANMSLSNLLNEDEINETEYLNMQNYLNQLELKQTLLKPDVTNSITDQLKSEVNQSISNAKIDAFTTVTQIEETEALKSQGFSYYQILKLKAISKVTNKSISDLVSIEGVVTISANNEKEVNYEVVYDIFNEELKQKYTNYEDLAKDQVQGIMWDIKDLFNE